MSNAWARSHHHRLSQPQGLGDKQEIDLTHREFELIRYLAERQGSWWIATELLLEVWGYASAPNTALDQAVVRLRKKIRARSQHPPSSTRCTATVTA